jgi:hypothetical protein
MWFQSGQLALVPLSANRFCEMMSELTVAWLLLDAAVIADGGLKKAAAGTPDHAFYSGKIQSALYFAKNVLPGVEHKAQLLADEDKSPLEISDAAFATV